MSYESIDDNGRLVRCRKRHQCEWCSTWIEKGEMAAVRIYKWDDDFHWAQQHPECFAALRKSITDGLMWDGEFTPGEQGRGCLIGENNE